MVNTKNAIPTLNRGRKDSKYFQFSKILIFTGHSGRVNEQVQHEIKLQQKFKELVLRGRKV